MDNAPFNFARTNVALAPYTRYRIGGPARIALFPATIVEMHEAHQWLMETGIPFIILGGGTNMLIDGRGFAGAVLFTTELKELAPLGEHRFRVGAGCVLGELVRQVMVPNNYSGVGALTGIPGTVGGALFMNAGTVNGSICQLASEVALLDERGLRTVPINAELYGYRGQFFCTNGSVIAEGIFSFTPSNQNETEVYEHYLRRRRETQPEGWCCGSVFKNPPGDHAGRLIEAAGLKGTRRNGAVISKKHANFIMNENSATFDDVLYLINLVKQKVHEKFGVDLHEEVRIIFSP